MNNSKINVDHTINSGQVFLWQNIGKYWYGVDGQNVIKAAKDGSITPLHNGTDFFRRKDRIGKIISDISRDSLVEGAVKRYPGLRVTRQDPFQCLISFIVSSNSNISKIKSSLHNLCRRFGEKIQFDGREFFLFPEPLRLAKADIQDILMCGTGYRSTYIKNAAKIVAQKKIDFDYLKKCSYYTAKKAITSMPGIGNKVADCILLFSLEKLDAFPLDRWMVRVFERYYSDTFQINTKTITEKQYNILHEKIIQHFGKNAGYAQQFLFKMEREDYEKKW